MKFSKTVEIAKPVDTVWRIFAIEFDVAYKWMASVPHSYAKTKGKFVGGAPMQGRICELSSSHTKNMVDEIITEYDESRHVIGIDVSPLNMPAIFPFRVNKVRVELTGLPNGHTRMRWDLHPHLKMAGYLLYPLVHVGLSKGFDSIIAELKYFVENGEPHPRKQAKIRKLAKAAA